MGSNSWARGVLADKISAALREWRVTGRRAATFDGYMLALDPQWIAAAASDPVLRTAWSFADEFFDAAFHGHDTVAGMPWPEAEAALQDVLERLRSGEPLDLPRSHGGEA